MAPPRTATTCRTFSSCTVGLPDSKSLRKRMPTPAAKATSACVSLCFLHSLRSAAPSACVDVQAACFSIVCSPHAKIFPFGKIHKKKHKIFPNGNKNAGSESWRLRCFRFLKNARETFLIITNILTFMPLKCILLLKYYYLRYVSIHSRPVRRLTPQPTDRGRADCPSLKGGVTKKDFIGSAVLSTSLFPLKGEVSSHKGIFDETAQTGKKKRPSLPGACKAWEELRLKLVSYLIQPHL